MTTPHDAGRGALSLALATPAPDTQTTINALLDGRTEAQQEAILHGPGPMLIFAGPGAGKTATMVRRIAYLIASGQARPTEILAVSFTARAADEVRVRLIDLIGVQQAKHVTVCTFHSVCARMIRPYAQTFGRNSDYTMHDPSTVSRLLKMVMSDADRTRIQYEMERTGIPPVKEVLDQISEAKNRLWSPPEYLEQSQHPLRALVAELWTELEAEMRESNAFDFDDLLVNSVRLLGSYEGIRSYYRDRYKWVLIDEFQDTNDAQMAFVSLLAGPHGNLTVIGDDDQAIYGFRLARVEHILGFAQTFPAAKTVVFGHNFRCREEILGPAVRTVSHNSQRHPKALIAVRGGGGIAQVCAFHDEEDEAAQIAASLAQQINTGQIRGSEVLVVCRQSRPMQTLQNRLYEQGIKVRLVGGQSLWERTEVKDAIAHLHLLANPYDAGAFSRALGSPTDRKPFNKGGMKAPTRGIDKGIALIVAFARDHEIDLIDAAIRVAEVPHLGVRRTALDQVAAFGRDLDRVRRNMWEAGYGQVNVGRAVIQTLTMDGGMVSAYQALRDSGEDAVVRRDATRVLDDLRSLIRTAQNYEEGLVERGEAPTLTGFLEHLGVDGAGQTGHQEVDSESDDRVTLSTIHGAKGTESRLVYLLGAEEGLLPNYRTVQDGDIAEMEEERRLFYVAATRAKDMLILTHCRTRGGRHSQGPSRFLTEAGFAV